MGLPASLSPETWATLAPRVTLDRATLDALAIEWRSLLAVVRQQRPTEATEAETDALVRLAAFGVSVARLLGADFPLVQRTRTERVNEVETA